MLRPTNKFVKGKTNSYTPAEVCVSEFVRVEENKSLNNKNEEKKLIYSVWNHHFKYYQFKITIQYLDVK